MTRLENAFPGSNFAARLLAGIALAGVLAVAQAVPLHADEVDDLRAEVQQLKQQMNYLQNQIPGAGAAGVSGGGTIAAQQEVRMQQLTSQMSQLQGQIEQLGIKVDDLATRLEQMQKDTQFRLGELESGGATGAMAAGTAASMPAAAPAAAPAATTPAPLPTTADQMNAGAGLPGPEGTTQVPEPTAPGTLGTIAAGTELPVAPAGAAEAAAEAAAQSQATQNQAAAAAVDQDPSTIQLPGNSPQEQYEYATGLLQRGAYPEAGLAFKAFVAQHPKDPLAGNAQYWLGETYYAQSDYKSAAIAFAEGYQKYPKSAKAPDNLLKLGMSLGQTGRKNDACTAFKQLASQFPKASAAIKDRASRAQQRYGCTG
ncbi:tol-pal system protein YbgF [Dongia sp.]|uniref:tol-pal system protein YbgF n=1 Tax=Dongia sp. TaxID=1977262 RepID=UPI003750528A